MKNLIKSVYLYFIFIIPILFPVFSFSQTITGRIFDENSALEDVLVTNLNRKESVFSKAKGEFTIQASINDSISFSALAHKTMIITVKKNNFNTINVFELKQKLNELDEVQLSGTIKNKFNPKTYSFETSYSLAEDMKRNPYLYNPISKYSKGINFLELFKLFKKKKNHLKQVEEKYIAYGQFDSLFNNSPLFNDGLLRDNLKIPVEDKSLFFDYCSARKLNHDLLAQPEHMVLLDSLFRFSETFKKGLKN